MNKLLLKSIGILLLIHLTACGGSQNETTENEINILDTTPPVITLIGESLITLAQNDEYIEQGATAVDDQDGIVEVTISGTVDTNNPGNYTVNYSATDTSGNTSHVTRTIIVEPPSDEIPPVISLVGESTVSVIQGNEYIELGASAFDESDGNVEVIISGEVNTNVIGNYIVTYSATDSANNTSSLTREILVTADPNTFITIWKTDNEGVSEDNQIKIDTTDTGYDFRVDWGDGTNDENITGDITHTYETAGTYTVTISGTFPQIYFEQREYDWDSNSFIYHSDNAKILSVLQWGNNTWHSMEAAFIDCINLNGMAIDAPNLSQVTNMSRMFKNARTFNQNIDHWNVSNVVDMSEMFRSAYRFNQPLDSWDVSNVTKMEKMFADAHDFNQDITGWNISSVTSLYRMFFSAHSFNQPIGSWNVSAVNDMTQMFASAYKFNQNIEGWDVSSVVSMVGMFSQAKAFNQPLQSWNVSSVNNMSRMFNGTDSFNKEIGNWNVSNVRNMSEMFENAILFNQALNDWDVSLVTSMEEMFKGASLFNQSLINWNVSSVKDFSGMFKDAFSFNQSLNSWNTSSANYMSSMFSGAQSFNQNLGYWDVSGVYTMVWMLDETQLSTENYDALLLGWSAQTVQNNVTFSAQNIRYSSSAENARNTLVSAYGWSISDAGVTP